MVSEKGQVTIPKALRARLGIAPGDALEFAEQEGRLVAAKISPVVPVDEVYGILSLGRSTDEFVDELRGGTADA